MTLRYFQLEEVVETDPLPGEMVLKTAAILSCSTCDDVIDGMGGPGRGAICVRCAEVLMSGRAKGCIKWD